MKIRHLNLNGTVYDISGDEYLSELSAENNPWFFTESMHFYVDVNGSDDNDGLSFSTPFKTIQKAIDKYNEKYVRVRYECTIHINAGTYNENVDIYNCSILNIELHGNVSINGSLKMGHSDIVVFCNNDENYKLSIMEAPITDKSAVLGLEYTTCAFLCDVGVSGNIVYPCRIQQSNAYFSKDLTAYNNGNRECIACLSNAQVNIKDVVVSGTGNTDILADEGSIVTYTTNTNGNPNAVNGGRIYSADQSYSGEWSVDDATAGIIVHEYVKKNGVITLSIGIHPARMLSNDVIGHVPDNCKPAIYVYSTLPTPSPGFVSVGTDGIIRAGCPLEDGNYFTTLTYVEGN